MWRIYLIGWVVGICLNSIGIWRIWLIGWIDWIRCILRYNILRVCRRIVLCFICCVWTIFIYSRISFVFNDFRIRIWAKIFFRICSLRISYRWRSWILFYLLDIEWSHLSIINNLINSWIKNIVSDITLWL